MFQCMAIVGIFGVDSKVFLVSGGGASEVENRTSDIRYCIADAKQAHLSYPSYHLKHESVIN